jgi:N-acetylglucosaminyldiphosphoundecaprenol N-acetyl-beta-D-mannosaminyltransferase
LRTEGGARAQTFRVLGIEVDAVQIPEVVQKIETWIQQSDACHFIAVTGMHGVMEAKTDVEFKKILNSADLVVPDGMPLVWVGRLRGLHLARRVYGPELMLSVCERTATKRLRHFLFGGAPKVPEQLAQSLRKRFPGMEIVGMYSPPFRTLTDQEDEQIIATINAATPDILWVGLSTPKQEKWMYQHRDRLLVPVLIGVGAAFDINSGRKSQAPLWMREHGMEWFFRLIHEPRRLWRRYLVYGPKFILYVALELLGINKSE